MLSRPSQRLRGIGLLAAISLIGGACAHANGTHASAELLAAARTEMSSPIRRDIRFACLPREGDSTTFRVVVILDSLQEKRAAGLTLVRGERAAPRPGYTNQTVTVEVQRAGETRVSGTSCWHDAGIVVRGSEAAMKDLTMYLSPAGTVIVQVADSLGRRMAEDVRSARQGTTERIRWRIER